MNKNDLDNLVEKLKSFNVNKLKYFFGGGGSYKIFYDEYLKEIYPNNPFSIGEVRSVALNLINNTPINLQIVEKVNGTNVALKCVYNDNDFSKQCSPELCEYNWKSGGIYCKQLDNPCRQGKADCYESRIWIDFKFGVGVYQNGPRAGKAIPIKNAKVGKVAILTTRMPNTPETDRYIFGIFDIADIKRDNEKDYYIHGNKETSIKIDPKIKLKFHDFYKNKNSSKEAEDFWGSGLFRLPNDEEIYKILISLKNEYEKNNLSNVEINKINNLINKYKK
jgi:hypothetical protein